MRGHVAIITETESTYVMIESTLRLDDVEEPRVLVGSKMGTSETGLEVTPLCLGYEREEGEEG